MTDEPKHISKLSAAGRALAQQQVQHALLCIVAQQGAPVRIPVSELDMASENFRLVIEQTSDGMLILSAELAEGAVEIVDALPHEIDAINGSKLN